VVDRPRIFHSQFAHHSQNLPKYTNQGNPYYKLFGLTPIRLAFASAAAMTTRASAEGKLQHAGLGLTFSLSLTLSRNN
jgi:hypothetical protein